MAGTLCARRVSYLHHYLLLYNYCTIPYCTVAYRTVHAPLTVVNPGGGLGSRVVHY